LEALRLVSIEMVIALGNELNSAERTATKRFSRIFVF